MESIGVLAGGIAHDFNNLLTAISGYGQILQEGIPPDDQLLRESAEQVLNAAERAAELTRNLLTFSRKQVINPKPVHVDTLISNTGRLIQRIIGEDIRFIHTVSGKGLSIKADPGQIEQVLMNLATNSRDAMPQGGTLRITSAVIETKQDIIASHGTLPPGSYVRLTVEDTGIGMDERTRERLFEPFFTTKEMGKGTGLGLASSYGVVKQHRGVVDVESEPGKGTSFHLYFPLHSTTEPAEALRPVQNVTGGTETILVAEDDEALRNLTRSVLTEFGYSVIEAADGEEAVNRFREDPDRIAMLLSDVIMPKKNGKDALGEMRLIRPGLKVLFMSGYSADIISKQGILDENIDVISKPISPVELLQKLRSVLDRR
jgi:CheY-like chemotaxis protein